MKLRVAVVALAVLVVGALAGSASAGTGLNAYKVKFKGAKQLSVLKRQGFDLTEGIRRKRIEIVATRTQVAKLRRAGLRTKVLRDRRGRTARQLAAAAADSPWTVWRPWARTDVPVSGSAGNPTANLKTQMENLAAKYPKIAKLETIGKSIRGVPIYAMKVTNNAKGTKDGSRPAVLYSALQHSREWLAGEVERRTLRLFLDNYDKTGTAVGTDGEPVAGVSSSELTSLVNTRELWFILVANPDGYDFTFAPENRLWRKNLHDNNGDGQITAVDGVDPNRNFPNHWKWDAEGSNTDTSSETYRGTAPASEPETRAFLSLTDRVHFAWNKTTTPSARSSSGPSAGQIDTHPADEPLMTALAGNDAKPGIPGFDPDVAADLYTANGETNDQLYSSYGTISYTVEGTPGEGTGSGFIFPDDEAQVQADFEKHVQIALDLARSAADPSRPKSHLGNSAPDFVIEHPFDTSFGNPQTVEVDARR